MAADEQAMLDAWIAADPRHAVAFARAEAAWELAARLKGALQGLESCAGQRRQHLARRAFLKVLPGKFLRQT